MMSLIYYTLKTMEMCVSKYDIVIFIGLICYAYVKEEIESRLRYGRHVASVKFKYNVVLHLP